MHACHWHLVARRWRPHQGGQITQPPVGGIRQTLRALDKGGLEGDVAHGIRPASWTGEHLAPVHLVRRAIGGGELRVRPVEFTVALELHPQIHAPLVPFPGSGALQQTLAEPATIVFGRLWVQAALDVLGKQRVVVHYVRARIPLRVHKVLPASGEDRKQAYPLGLKQPQRIDGWVAHGGGNGCTCQVRVQHGAGCLCLSCPQHRSQLVKGVGIVDDLTYSLIVHERQGSSAPVGPLRQPLFGPRVWDGEVCVVARALHRQREGHVGGDAVAHVSCLQNGGELSDDAYGPGQRPVQRVQNGFHVGRYQHCSHPRHHGSSRLAKPG